MAGRTLEQLDKAHDDLTESHNRLTATVTTHMAISDERQNETRDEVRGLRQDLEPVLLTFKSGGMIKRGVISLIVLMGTLVGIVLGIKNILK